MATEVIPVDDYADHVAGIVGRSAVTELPLDACRGLVLARDVVADVALPPFDNSGMDGYAVRAVDVAGAPVSLPVTEDIPAGRTDIPRLEPATAHRIMTGAPMPDGADAVVRVEDTDAGTSTVRIDVPVPAGTSVRTAGSDIAAGTTALTAGTVLAPAHLGLAAAVGLDRLAVFAPLRVLVISTGSELVTPPATLEHGQIYESNSVAISAALRELGCHVDVLRTVADDVPAFRASLSERLGGVDLVVTSGGVSAGAYEVVKDALGSRGVEFRRVAMQPGGPQGCGRVDGVPVVTLPGNPVSVLVSFEVFLRPAILAAQGHSATGRPRVRARLSEALTAPAGKRQFRRGFLTSDDTVAPVGGPGSHLLAAFTQANCLIVVPEAVTELAAGDDVDVLLLSQGR